MSLISAPSRSAWERRTWGQALGGIVKKASKSVLTSVLGAEDFDNVRFAVSEESVKRTAVKMLEVVHNHGGFERWQCYKRRRGVCGSSYIFDMDNIKWAGLFS